MQYPDLGLLILRIGFGIVFVLHGWTKIKNPAQWARNMGLPTIVGLLVAIAEFFGGLGVLFGFLTQIAALGPLIVMLGALCYHIFVWKHKFINLEGGSWEYAFFLAVAALAIALLGAGTYSLDAYFGFYP